MSTSSSIIPESEKVSKFERFLPFNSASTIEDAPGWQYQNKKLRSENDGQKHFNPSSETKQASDLLTSVGPVCWKCKGMKYIYRRNKNKKKKRKIQATNRKTLSLDSTDGIDQQTTDTDETFQIICSVCDGKGHIPCKQKEIIHRTKPGVVTKTRTCPTGWKPKKPLPYAIEQVIGVDVDEKIGTTIDYHKFVKSIHAGLSDDMVVPFKKSQTQPLQIKNLPSWIPQNGEQLCNLVGSWRILQRVGSHRWTTDDLVTAYVASSHFINEILASSAPSHSTTTMRESENTPPIRYLDLGCGNGSVLQMVLWRLLSHFDDHEGNGSNNNQEDKRNIFARGIEARKEAVNLAKRSLSYNVGYNHSTQDNMANLNIDIIHSDFRTLIEKGTSILNCATEKEEVNSPKFDLVTGTPPYFQVDFETKPTQKGDDTTMEKDENNNHTNKTRAIINQGGMPTSVQSAPARCEFRGGIEVYCQAASKVLKPFTGIFCVCENYLNHSRVLASALESGLVIERVFFVRGKVGRRVPLFAVYVMKKKRVESERNQSVGADTGFIEKDLAVRDGDDKWTNEYKSLLEYMSIPAC